VIEQRTRPSAGKGALLTALAVLSLSTLAGCLSVDADGFKCGKGGECPPGFRCWTGTRCYRQAPDAHSDAITDNRTSDALGARDALDAGDAASDRAPDLDAQADR
jgi:hypothetical protein